MARKTGMAWDLSLIGPIFDGSVPKARYVACSLRLINVLWGSSVVLLIAAAPSLPADLHAAGSLTTLLSTILLLPLVQNAIYLFLVDLAVTSSRAQVLVALAAALLATLLHTPRPDQILSLFGAYFVSAAVYLAWRARDRGFGFWLGVALHSLFTMPAAVMAYLG